MEHSQVCPEIEGTAQLDLPFVEHAGWRVRVKSSIGFSPWELIDDEEYARCKDRPEHEFEEVLVQPSPETQRKFSALLSIGAVHISRFPDGRHWVAVHPQHAGLLWWSECSLSLSECLELCHSKAVRMGFFCNKASS